MGACSCKRETFSTYITPYQKEFEIHKDASKLNNIYKEGFRLIKRQDRPFFDEAWKQFEDWMWSIGIDKK